MSGREPPAEPPSSTRSDEVVALFAGPGVHICESVRLFADEIAKRRKGW
jgi:hypothetical protein